MADERRDDADQHSGSQSGAHEPETDRPALFPTEGLAPGEDVEGGRLAELGVDPTGGPDDSDD